MALSDCTLQDFDGPALTAIHAKNPEGYWVGKPVAATGAQAFSVVGAAATYFTVATDPDMGMGIVCTGTPVPDNWDGILVLRQTDPVDGTHDTPFALGVIGSAGKPTTGLWAMTPTIHWLRRKVIMDRHAAERTLFYNPAATFATTLTATTISELTAHFNTLRAAADGVSNYRILCRWNGISSGSFAPSNGTFGTGYLQIEADAGYRPALLFSQTADRNWSGVIFHKIGIVTSSANAYTFRFAGSVATGTAYNPRIMFHDCDIGNKLWEAEGADQTPGNWGVLMLARFMQECIIEACRIDGIKVPYLGTARIMVYSPEYTRRLSGDLAGIAAQMDGNKPATFANDNSYYFIQPRLWHSLDNYSNAASGDPVHRDVIQIRPSSGTIRLCTTYIHIENSFACAGGTTYQKAATATRWATPTVQVFMDNGTASGCPNEVSMFNAFFAAGSGRGVWQATSGGNISLAWASFPLADRSPAISPPSIDPQLQGAVGKAHIWKCMLSSGGGSSGAPLGGIQLGSGKWHHQKNVHVNFFSNSTAANEPGAVTKGDVVPYARVGANNLWSYPLNYDQSAQAFESDLSRQLHHAGADLASTVGARLRETHVVTPPGGAAVTLAIAA